jgi:hypothetical protein
MLTEGQMKSLHINNRHFLSTLGKTERAIFKIRGRSKLRSAVFRVQGDE